MNCLDAAGIRTVRELVSCDEGRLLNLRAFGQVQLREIKQKLGRYGLRLKMSPDDFAD